jgi:hypothetical protein
MTSAINPAVIIDDVPVSKSAVRNQLAHARDEITELQRLLVTQTTQSSPTAYALTYTEAVAYANGQVFRMRLNASASVSATTVTLNVNNQGATPIREWNGTSLVDVPGWRFAANAVMTVVYNATVPCFMLIDTSHPAVGKFVLRRLFGTSVTVLEVPNLPARPTIDFEIDQFVPATAGQDLLLQVSTDNGTTYVTTGYLYSNQVLNDTASAYEGSSTASGWKLAGPIPIVSPQYFNGSVRLFTGATSAGITGAQSAQWTTRAPHATDDWNHRQGTGHRSSNTVINAVRFVLSGSAAFTMSANVIL